MFIQAAVARCVCCAVLACEPQLAQGPCSFNPWPQAMRVLPAVSFAFGGCGLNGVKRWVMRSNNHGVWFVEALFVGAEAEVWVVAAFIDQDGMAGIEHFNVCTDH